jgi:hypothetical protein
MKEPTTLLNLWQPPMHSGYIGSLAAAFPRTCCDYLSVSARMNVDCENFAHAEGLLQILADHGFAGKVRIYIGQLVGIDECKDAPSTSYRPCCFTREFARSSAQENGKQKRVAYGARCEFIRERCEGTCQCKAKWAERSVAPNPDTTVGPESSTLFERGSSQLFCVSLALNGVS